MASTFLLIFLLCWIVWSFVHAQQSRQRELGRLNTNIKIGAEGWDKKIDRWFESFGRAFTLKRKEQRRHQRFERDISVKLRAAGVETTSDHGRYLFVRAICLSSWPVITVVAWVNFTPYYATVTTIFTFAFVVLVPYLWLSRKTVNRTEDIQRELPLVIDLTNLATSSGWDVSSALERVIDALAPEFPRHPLIKELRQARWLASSGYTWEEALDRVSRKVGDDTVTRVSIALSQALVQGGDRSAQLSGIAADAQRTYYAALDKRLAAIPVKALIITMVLFLTYFTILLAPAVVGVTGSITAL